MPAAAMTAASAYLAMSPALVAGTTISALVFINSLPARAGRVPRGRGTGCMWHARRDSNPQPAVLETAALPIELLAYRFSENGDGGSRRLRRFQPRSGGPERDGYLMIFATT